MRKPPIRANGAAPLPDIRPPVLDEIDRQLIAALQINARESVAMLARQLGIDLRLTSAHLKALREEVTHSDLSLHCESHASSESRTALNSPKPAVAVSGPA